MILIDLIHKLQELPLKAETATVRYPNDQEVTEIEYDTKNNIIRLHTVKQNN